MPENFGQQNYKMKGTGMEQIRFVLERFFYGWKMGALVFDKDDELIYFCLGTIEKIDSSCKELDKKTFLKNENTSLLFSTLKEKCKKTKIPVIHMEEDGIYYIGFCDKEEHFFIFGPASAETLSFVQQVTYRKRHHVSNQKYQVPKVSFAKSLNGVALVYYMLTGMQITEAEIMKASKVESDSNIASSEILTYEIQNTTEHKQHLAYQEEVRWLTSIENGTLETKEKRMTPENLKKVEQIGTLASSNSLKQFEYMVVTSAALATRAAIRGGVNAYEAYQLSEIFMQKTSKCTSVMEMLQIHMEISETFTKLVCDARKNRNSDCVEQCKDYIARHRTKKFSLNDVAEAIGKNPSYLSRIFSEQTGMTMQDYALNLRLEAAANILQYSNENVGNIAEYLNFPSQSYFGERFKKKYGVTPAEYRKQHKIRDFKE